MARSGNPAARGAIGLADLPDKAPTQQEEITKQGIDCVNRCAACPPGGCPVRLGAPVGPLHQGHAEDAGTVAQASHGVAHDASSANTSTECLVGCRQSLADTQRESTRVSDTPNPPRGWRNWAAVQCPLETRLRPMASL